MALEFRTLIFSALLSAGLLHSQNPDVRVLGRAVDSSGAAVSGVTVQLHSRTSSASYTAMTDDAGSYSLLLPRGQYLLEANAPSLSLSPSTRVVEVDSAMDLPIEMGVEAMSTAVQVTATGTAQSLDETAKAVDIV